MTPEEIRALVSKAHEAYAHGERAFFADLIDDDIEWTIYGPSESFPIPNRMRGKAEVLAALQMIDEHVEILSIVPELVLIDGEYVAVIVDRHVRQRSTGRTLRYKAAGFQRFRNGRMIEYQGFIDNFEMIQQAFGRSAEGAAPAGP
jgi:ketosteroid isomerase-like protein